MFNGAVIVQIYFLLSGIVLALPFLERMAKHKFNFKIFILATIGRYIRLTPAYAIVILVNATFVYRLSSGPYWEQLVGSERQRCRENWWTNVLYINNQVHWKDMVSLLSYLGEQQVYLKNHIKFSYSLNR